MNDRELLEWAAKAAGHGTYAWNPLESDQDALRLAVKLHLDINSYPVTEEVAAVQHRHNGVCYGIEHRCFERTWNQDAYAATRRAIVRAASEIGKAMEG